MLPTTVNKCSTRNIVFTSWNEYICNFFKLHHVWGELNAGADVLFSDLYSAMCYTRADAIIMLLHFETYTNTKDYWNSYGKTPFV